MSYDDRDSKLAASCVMSSFEGAVVPEWLVERVEGGLGGVCLFAQNVVSDHQVALLTAQLHAARAGVVIAVDEEGGDVTRLDAAHGSDTPSPAAFGVVDDPELTRSAFRSLGSRLAGLGIDLSLAPCADINSNPRNPIIGVRSFGADAELVSHHVLACVAGFHDAGVGACVKHFPGHGDTVADTHLGAARVDATVEEMQRRELVPFRAAAAAGVDAVLTAHIVAQCVDDRPASLSHRWTQYLRNGLGYDGVIITDALDMGAVSGDGVPAAAVQALIAGADFLCLGANFDAAQTDAVVAAIALAMRDGHLDRGGVEESAARLAKLRRHHTSSPAIDPTAATEVARRAIVIDGVVPAGLRVVVECRPKPSMASFNVTWGLARHLARWERHTIHDVGGLTDVEGGAVVVVRDLDVHPWQREVIHRVSPAVVVELGWPSAARPTCDAYIVSHGAAQVSTRAVAELLAGGGNG